MPIMEHTAFPNELLGYLVVFVTKYILKCDVVWCHYFVILIMCVFSTNTFSALMSCQANVTLTEQIVFD